MQAFGGNMLCECFGNMKKVEKIKIVDGKRVKTGIFRRICDRCAFDISEAQYQKMANKQIQADADTEAKIQTHEHLMSMGDLLFNPKLRR